MGFQFGAWVMGRQSAAGTVRGYNYPHHNLLLRQGFGSQRGDQELLVSQIPASQISNECMKEVYDRRKDNMGTDQSESDNRPAWWPVRSCVGALLGSFRDWLSDGPANYETQHALPKA